MQKNNMAREVNERRECAGKELEAERNGTETRFDRIYRRSKMRVLKGAAIAVAILLALGLGVGCCLLAVTDAGAVLTVMQFVLLCALVFYAVLAVLALVKIAQNTDRGDR